MGLLQVGELDIKDKRLINSLEIGALCPVAWDAMDGDDRVRHCGQCKMNVYDISEMPGPEAVELIKSKEGERLCVKLYRRWDGTVATSNCPVGLRWTRNLVKVGVICLVAAVVWVGCMDEASAQDIVRSKVEGKGFVLEGIPIAHSAASHTSIPKRHHDLDLIFRYGAVFLVALITYFSARKVRSVYLVGLVLVVCFAVVGGVMRVF